MNSLAHVKTDKIGMLDTLVQGRYCYTALPLNQEYVTDHTAQISPSLTTHHDHIGVVALGLDVEVNWAVVPLGLLVDDALRQLVVAGSPARGGWHHVEGAERGNSLLH